MRRPPRTRHLVAAAAAVLALAATSLACKPIEQLDQEIRINQIQAMGSHNSYHEISTIPERQLRRSVLGAVDDAFTYSHRPIDVQLQHEKVRQLELDVFDDPAGGPVRQPPHPPAHRRGRLRPGDEPARHEGAPRPGRRLPLQLPDPAGLPHHGEAVVRRQPDAHADRHPPRAEGREHRHRHVRLRGPPPVRRPGPGPPRRRDPQRVRTRGDDRPRRRPRLPPHPRGRGDQRRLAHAGRVPRQGDVPHGQRRLLPDPLPGRAPQPAGPGAVHQRQPGRRRRRLRQAQRRHRVPGRDPGPGAGRLHGAHPGRRARGAGRQQRPEHPRRGPGQRGPVGQHRLPGARPRGLLRHGLRRRPARGHGGPLQPAQRRPRAAGRRPSTPSTRSTDPPAPIPPLP